MTIDFGNSHNLVGIAHYVHVEYENGETVIKEFYRDGVRYDLHHRAKFPRYAPRKDKDSFYAYEGKFGKGYVRFLPIPGERGALCTVEYWIRQEKT